MTAPLRVMQDTPVPGDVPRVATPDVTIYPRDAILRVEQVAAALQVSTRTIERMDIPYFTAGKARRYVWGQVLDDLSRKATAAR